MINGFKWYLGLENGSITLYKDRDSFDGYSIYSNHITADERRQIKESDAYREFAYIVWLN